MQLGLFHVKQSEKRAKNKKVSRETSKKEQKKKKVSRETSKKEK